LQTGGGKENNYDIGFRKRVSNVFGKRGSEKTKGQGSNERYDCEYLCLDQREYKMYIFFGKIYIISILSFFYV
jgi:hypothetical protein